MKRIRIAALLLAVVMAVTTVHAQQTVAAARNCCAVNQHLTGQDALQWAKDNVGQLAAAYLATCGNKLDPDEVRKQLAPIGYDGTNVPDYRLAEKWLVDTIYRQMMRHALEQGNRSITLLTGPGGSGKSTFTRTMDFSAVGLLYDSAFNSYSSLKAAIDKALATGMDDITVIAFYNDIESCYINSIRRGKATNRFLGLAYLTNAFRSNAGKIRSLRTDYPSVKLMAVDNNHNNGGQIVTTEQAEQWDFTVDATTLNRLLVYVLNEIYQAGITGAQITSAVGDIANVQGLDDTGRVLADEIARHLP